MHGLRSILLATLTCCYFSGLAASPGKAFELLLIHHNIKGDDKNLAYIRSHRSEQTSSFAVGQPVFKSGYVVKRILSDSVVLADAKGKEFALKLEKAPEVTIHRRKVVKPLQINPKVKAYVTQKPANVYGLPKPKKRTLKRDKSFGIDVITYESGSNYRRFALSGRDYQKLLKHQMRLLSQVQFTTAKSMGKVVGLQIKFMNSKPLVASFGVENGDIVTAINQIPVVSFQHGMQIYKNLAPDTPVIKVDLLRKGTPQILFYELESR